MPYIKREERDKLVLTLNPLMRKMQEADEGHLNYVITKLCLAWLAGQEAQGYKQYNAIIGALESAKLEMYRRAVARYEDMKSMENGEVYPPGAPLVRMD